MSKRELELRRLTAELQAELDAIYRVVEELRVTKPQTTDDERQRRLAWYATAALLETFYSVAEKSLRRIAAAFEGLPTSEHWHRDLLATMVLTIPEVRPAVLRETTAKWLGTLLAFRHRFRNLYLFDLEPQRIDELRQLAEPVWQALQQDMSTFLEFIRLLAVERSAGH